MIQFFWPAAEQHADIQKIICFKSTIFDAFDKVQINISSCEHIHLIQCAKEYTQT